MSRALLLALLALLALAALPAAEDPFVDGKVEIRHDGDQRTLVFSARNVSGKDIRTVIIAYVLRDRSGHVVESDILRCARKDGAPAVPKDFAGPVWEMPIVEDAVITASFGCQEADFVDGSRWLAPTIKAKP